MAREKWVVGNGELSWSKRKEPCVGLQSLPCRCLDWDLAGM